MLTGNLYCIIGVLMLLSGTSLKGQTLIAGIPNADVTHPGLFALTHETQLKPDISAWNSFNFLTYGAGRNAEVCLSLFNLALPQTHNFTIGAGFKKYVKLFKKNHKRWDWRLTGGQLLLLGTQRNEITRHGSEIGGWGYAHLSTRIPKLKTRLTFGANYASKHVFGRTGRSVMVGFEQPIYKRFMVVADWISGLGPMGNLIAGIQIPTIGEDVLILAWKVPNNPHDGQAFVLEYTIHLDINQKDYQQQDHENH